MKTFIFLNETLSPSDCLEQVLHSKAFKYGVSLIETIRVVDGRMPFIKGHIKRLVDSAPFLNFPLIDEEELVLNLNKVIEVSFLNSAKIRLQLSFDDQNQALYAIEIEAYIEEEFVLNKDGLKIGLYIDNFKSHSPLSNLKTGNYLLLNVAEQFAQEKAWDQAVLVNGFGNIVETNIANIFLIKNEEVITPSLESGCVSGVMRMLVINYLKEKGFEVKEEKFTFELMMSAQNVFVTNALKGICFVKEFMGYQYDPWDGLDNIIEYLNDN